MERKIVKGITIDGATSKDLDDSFWIEVVSGGHILYISIADVGSLVEKDSEVDKSAKHMGSTKYRAGNNHKPMFPERISYNSASLLPKKNRPTLTAKFFINSNGELGDPEFFLSLTTSQYQFSYEIADKVIGEGKGPFAHELAMLSSIAKTLLQKRRTNGALALYDLSRGIITTEEGFIVAMKSTEEHISNIIVQELMILFNTALSAYAAENDISILYRNHTVKQNAPARNELLQEIEEIVSSNDTVRLTNLIERTYLVLNRAVYEPVLRGHYGLNLPAYCHASSPIRRFADLVNHRCITAHLLGEQSPYTTGELKEIGDHLNAIRLEEMLTTQSYFKTMAKAGISRQAEVHGYKTMDADTFYKALAIAVKQGKFTQALEDEVRTRANRDALEPRELFVLLFHGAGEEWLELKRLAVKYLGDHRWHSASIFQIAGTEKICSVVKLATRPVGPDNDLLFESVATVEKEKNEWVSAPAQATSKKAAEHTAQFQLLSQIAGCPALIPLLRTPKVESPYEQSISSPKVVANGSNFIGLLQEWCMQSGLELPEYKTESVGTITAPSFSEECTVRLKSGEVFTSTEADKSKKSAKKKAAQNVYQQLIDALSNK